MSINSILVIIMILMNVAFYTLIERKILSYIQTRKGPNKVSMWGLLQPMSDALKLMTKAPNHLENTNNLMQFMSPPIMLMISLTMLMVLPVSNNMFTMNLNTMVIIIISSTMIHTMLMMSWSSNSSLSFLGCIRSVAQMISYEVTFFMIMLLILMMSNKLNMQYLANHQHFMWLMWGLSPMLILWLITCMAETNRSPFDFAESESELVSGFNIEFSSNPFTLIFLTEYANILLMMIITTILFSKMSSHLSIMLILTLSTLMLWVRGTYPRLRYDILMRFNWKMSLPLVLTLMIPMTNYMMSIM